MRHIFVNYSSLRLKLKKKTTTPGAQYSQLHSPERAQKESEKCSLEVFPAEINNGRQPGPVLLHVLVCGSGASLEMTMNQLMTT